MVRFLCQAGGSKRARGNMKTAWKEQVIIEDRVFLS
jgi:hypothetical protein